MFKFWERILERIESDFKNVQMQVLMKNRFAQNSEEKEAL